MHSDQYVREGRWEGSNTRFYHVNISQRNSLSYKLSEDCPTGYMSDGQGSCEVCNTKFYHVNISHSNMLTCNLSDDCPSGYQSHEQGS